MKIKTLLCCALTAVTAFACTLICAPKTDSVSAAVIREPVLRPTVPQVAVSRFPFIPIEPSLTPVEPKPSATASVVPSLMPAEPLPSSYCLKDDYIIYTQHQDSHGLCWNFAATMAATTTLAKATNEYYDFSELWTALTSLTVTGDSKKFGEGGNFSDQRDAMLAAGLMLESDMPYQTSFTISTENAYDYYNFYAPNANVNLANTLTSVSYSRKDVDKIKQHILDHGSLYLAFSFSKGFVESNGTHYLPPNQTKTSGGHAVTLLGWDDNYEKEVYLDGATTPTTFKGAWIIMNSYTETSGVDGINYVFYDDKNSYSFYGYKYSADTDKDFYFYDKVESGYAYPIHVKGKYHGDYTAQTGVSKHLNIFYDDVDLEYSYQISDGASIQSVEIFRNDKNVTKDFQITVNHETKRFRITKANTPYGQYKIWITYGNGNRTETYLNNFIVTHGLVREEIEYDYANNTLGFNTGKDLEYYGFTTSDKDYVIYTNKTSGTLSFLPLHTSVYSENNVTFPTFSYEIGADGTYVATHTVTANTGYPLTYTFHFEYYQDTTLQPVNVFYDLGGGTNNPKNYEKELANASTNLLLYEPTREGYTFDGWFLDYGNGSKKLEKVGDAYPVAWEDIHHMGENPTLFGLSHYKTYYKNSNVLFVYAHWKEDPYHTVSLSITGNGSSHMGKTVILGADDEAHYTFTPEKGYCISEVKLNGTPLSSVEILEITQNGLLVKNLTEDLRIEVTFSQGSFLSISVGDNVETAYVVAEIDGKTQKFYDGDFLPRDPSKPDYYSATYDFFVVVRGTSDGYAYVLEEDSSYTPVEKGVFTKKITIYSSNSSVKLSVKSAIATPVEQATITYQINTYVKGHYLSTDKNATEGAQFSGTYNVGDIVYLFIKTPEITPTYEYLMPTGFEAVSDLWYRKAFYVTATEHLGTIAPSRAMRSYTITWQNWDGTLLYSEDYVYYDFPIYDEYEPFPEREEDERYTYEFIGWSPVISSVHQDQTYTAIYKAIPKQYTVTLAPVENGTVTPGETTTVTCLDATSYSFTPDTGYRLKNVTVNGESLGAITSYTFADVHSNQTIRVEFEKITYSVTVICEENGSADKIGEHQVPHGEEFTFHLSPDEHYEVRCIQVNGESVEISESVTLPSITQNTVVNVSFIKTAFTLHLKTAGLGTITADNAINGIPQGENRVLTFTPKKGWELAYVFVNDKLVLVQNDQITLPGITQDISVTAVFARKENRAPWIIGISATAVAGIGGVSILLWLLLKARKKR
ncbi:MAG: InlB B-repeat-containing protein [Clostridia bacterium]|nr:InlB B-repeat-containing protein [Clostridia bacterium]